MAHHPGRPPGGSTENYKWSLHYRKQADSQFQRAQQAQEIADEHMLKGLIASEYEAADRDRRSSTLAYIAIALTLFCSAISFLTPSQSQPQVSIAHNNPIIADGDQGSRAMSSSHLRDPISGLTHYYDLVSSGGEQDISDAWNLLSDYFKNATGVKETDYRRTWAHNTVALHGSPRICGILDNKATVYADFVTYDRQTGNEIQDGARYYHLLFIDSVGWMIFAKLQSPYSDWPGSQSCP